MWWGAGQERSSKAEEKGKVDGHSVPEDNLPGQHFFIVEAEPRTEPSTLKHFRQPVLVIGPHSVVGHLIKGKPFRLGLTSFGWHPFEPFASENGAIQLESVHEIKMEIPHFLQAQGSHQ